MGEDGKEQMDLLWDDEKQKLDLPTTVLSQLESGEARKRENKERKEIKKAKKAERQLSHQDRLAAWKARNAGAGNGSEDAVTVEGKKTKKVRKGQAKIQSLKNKIARLEGEVAQMKGEDSKMGDDDQVAGEEELAFDFNNLTVAMPHKGLTLNLKNMSDAMQE